MELKRVMHENSMARTEIIKNYMKVAKANLQFVIERDTNPYEKERCIGEAYRAIARALNCM